MERCYHPLRRIWFLLELLALALLFAISSHAQTAERLSRFVISTAPPSAMCDEAKELGWLYLDTNADTDGALYFCRGATGWKAVDSGAVTSIDLAASGMVTGAADDQVLVGASANNAAWKTVPNCTTGKLLYTQSTNTISCGVDAVGVGGGGSGEYHPDNYPTAGVLLEDEFTSGATLTWTAQNPDSQTVTYDMGLVYLGAEGTTDAWHGITTPFTDDSQDWTFVAKVTPSQTSTATQGCGISIITEGTLAAPTEINSVYIRSTSSVATSIELLDHDDYDFAGTTSIVSLAVTASATEEATFSTHTIYLRISWVAATDDIGAGYSLDGIVWVNMSPEDTTVPGPPVGIGLFARDNLGSAFQFARVLTSSSFVISPDSKLQKIGS